MTFLVVLLVLVVGGYAYYAYRQEKQSTSLPRFFVRGVSSDGRDYGDWVIAESADNAAIKASMNGVVVSTVQDQSGVVVPVTPRMVVGPAAPAWSPGVAAVLSFFIPGLGQMYKGQVFNGLAWLAVTVVGYVALVVPGIILHLCCIVGAASGNPAKR